MNTFPRVRAKDVIGALVIGEAVAWLLFIMIRVNAPELPIPSSAITTLEAQSTGVALAVAFPILSILGLFVAAVLARIVRIIYQAAKFALVGALNTFVDLGVLNTFILVTGTAAGPSYVLFKAVSFAAALTNSYFWNKHWTFESTGRKVGRELLQFAGVSIVGFLLNVITAHVVVNIIGPQAGLAPTLWSNIGALAAVLVALFWNFVGYKFWVFKRSK